MTARNQGEREQAAATIAATAALDLKEAGLIDDKQFREVITMIYARALHTLEADDKRTRLPTLVRSATGGKHD